VITCNTQWESNFFTYREILVRGSLGLIELEGSIKSSLAKTLAFSQLENSSSMLWRPFKEILRRPANDPSPPSPTFRENLVRGNLGLIE
jgi:hypothetical protein